MVLKVLAEYLEPLLGKFERERMGKRNRYPVLVMMRIFIAGYVYQILPNAWHSAGFWAGF